uniref:CAAX amino terminal protease family n=1 Tax=Eubacterium cellulosolvens (strain ATCC 43171 / JCM 9499 / 6) TaxID=633697 RepID=I5AQW4_EUBC6
MEIPYSSIANSKPRHCRRSFFKRGPIRFWQALIFAVATTLAFLYTGRFVYRLIPSPQLANMFSELVFFVIAGLLFILLMKNHISSVLPFRKPKGVAVGGVFVILISFFLSAQAISILTLWLFPSQTVSASEDISSSMLSGSSVFLMLISTTLAPAVTEEILHRGIIFRGLKNSFRSRPLIMALTGILFGVFHISPVRWSMPILMGVIAAWIMLETDNIFYTMLLHFLYNSLLIGASLLARSMVPVDSAKLLNSVHLTGSTVGVVLCMYGLPVPLLLYTGCWLIRRSESVVKPAFLVQGRERKTLLQIIIPTVIILCVGLMLIFTDAIIG